MIEPIPYFPKRIFKPEQLIDVPSAWRGIESILDDILERFCIGRQSAIEFGVDYGYSTAAISNFFSHTIGVDTFRGDVHAGERNPDEQFSRVSKSLESFPITLVQMGYHEWILRSRGHYNLAHVDIVHTYQETYEAGLWAAVSSDLAIFHDTRSFPEVMRAVADVAEITQRNFYEWPECHGLGIVTRRKPL